MTAVAAAVATAVAAAVAMLVAAADAMAVSAAAGGTLAAKSLPSPTCFLLHLNFYSEIDFLFTPSYILAR